MDLGEVGIRSARPKMVVAAIWTTSGHPRGLRLDQGGPRGGRNPLHACQNRSGCNLAHFWAPQWTQAGPGWTEGGCNPAHFWARTRGGLRWRETIRRVRPKWSGCHEPFLGMPGRPTHREDVPILFSSNMHIKILIRSLAISDHCNYLRGNLFMAP